jgi:hypothetical protein
MRRVIAASAVLFAFATSAEARTQHHHYRHYAHAHYRHHTQHYGHYAHSRYRQLAERYGNTYMSLGSGFGDSGFGESRFENFSYQRPSYGYERSGYGRSSYRSAHGGGRPAAWCGWYMRQQVGADPGPQYNLARSWAHYGSNAGGPSVGTIVVWSHHVGKIVGRENGQWIVESGNDGHAVRTRPRSLAGAIAFRRA